MAPYGLKMYAYWPFNHQVLVLVCLRLGLQRIDFDSNLSLSDATRVTTALFDPVLTWRHHHCAASTSCCAHQHAAHLLPAVAALTFSTIMRLVLINSPACSVCFISKPAALSPGSLQQQQHRETRSQSLN